MISGAAKAVKTARDSHSLKGNNPFVELVEQPASKARFRYECEGRRLAGSIPGAKSTPDNRTFPTIRLQNYRGRGVVIVSCVTKDEPYRPHPHSLVGKDTCTRGICRIEIEAGAPLVKFTNLGIQCVKRKNIQVALELRRELRIDPFKTGYNMKESVGIDLNSVRLCFQVFIEGKEGKINVPLRPVVSQPIYDKKAKSDLTICKISHESATVEGGMEMIVLCEKVVRDNIQVRFFEKDDDGHEVWEGFGDFTSFDVHKQVAITLRTPSYRHRTLEEPIPINIELRRPTDGVTSEAWPFRMLPIEAFELESLRRKRRKFADCPTTNILRRLQAQAEKDAAASRHCCDPKSVEPGLQTFPFIPNLVAPFTDQSPSSNNQSLLVDISGYGAQVSPASQPSPVAYGSFNIPLIAQINAKADADPPLINTTPDTCGPSSSLDHCEQTQSRQPPLSNDENNFEEPEKDAVEDAEIIPMSPAASLQSCTLDTSLNIHNLLDSAELEAYSAALSESFWSGLFISDCSGKKEINADLGATPVASTDPLPSTQTRN